MSRRPVRRIAKPDPPRPGDGPVPDEPFIADYTNWWAPPPPMPPPRLRLALLIPLAVLFVLALCLALLAAEHVRPPPSF